MINRIYSKVINILLPNRCPICKKINFEQNGLCKNCWNKVNIIKAPTCNICNYPFEVDVNAETVCPSCIKKRPLYKKAKSIFIYNEFISKIIFDFKYKDKINSVKFFADILKANCSEIIEVIDIITPVPLHKQRLRERKYNQALLIAKELAKISGKTCINDLLIRKINNRPQVGLVGKERQKNVRGVFSFNEDYLIGKNFEQIKNKNILLVDDVMTTGATLNNCAKVLLKQKIKDVYVVTLARTVVGKHH